MTARDASPPLHWLGLALLLIGVFGALIAYRQCASTRGKIANIEAPATEPTPADGSLAPAPPQATEAVTGASGVRTAAAPRPSIDWDNLVEQKPETALQQLKLGAPRDAAEAQRFIVYEVRALTKLQRMGEARARAEAYFEHWPAGPDIVYLQSLTGAHPRPEDGHGERP